MDIHSERISETGLPQDIVRSQARFNDFLMHGYLDHHSTVQQFSVSDLGMTEIAALKCLLVEYVRKFGDPGLMLLSAADVNEILSEASSN